MALADIDLLLRRPGILLSIAGILVAAAALIHQIAVAPLYERVAGKNAERTRIEQMRAQSPEPIAPVKALHEERLAAFVDTLGDSRALPDLVRILFAEAEKRGVVLAHGEYKLEQDKPGQFLAYHISLPTRGTYPRLRAFADAVLSRIPFAALDDIDFKREAIGAAEAEARMRFVFFLRP